MYIALSRHYRNHRELQDMMRPNSNTCELNSREFRLTIWLELGTWKIVFNDIREDAFAQASRRCLHLPGLYNQLIKP